MADFDTAFAPWIKWRSRSPVLEGNSAVYLVAKGDGYLAGTFPDGITTVDGSPVSATVRAIVRSDDPSLDGLVVARVMSAQDGTWRIDGLHPDIRYDVVGRKNGFNDVIMSDVSPALD